MSPVVEVGTSLNVIPVEYPELSVVRVRAIERTTQAVTLVPGPKGDQGPPGADGGASAGVELTVVVPNGTWILQVPNSLGRKPNVTVYDTDGNVVIANVVATSTQVTITFSSPTAGSAALS